MKNIVHRTIPALAVLIVLGIATTVRAAEFCATNSQELQDALTTAASNGEDDVIRVATGQYLTPAGGFVYNADVSGGDDNDLTLVGGYTEFFGNPCGLVNENPWLTSLSGEGSSRVMRILPKSGSSANINVRRLSFINGKSGGFGGGLSIGGVGFIYGGEIVIERNVFMLNEAEGAAALDIFLTSPGASSQLRLVNNVLLANHATTSGGSARLVMNGGDDGLFGAGIFVINNSVINNTADGPFSGVLFVTGTVPNKYIINNNLWGNGGSDLQVVNTSGEFRLWNNNFGGRLGDAPDSESGNISIEPEYEPCGFLCFHLIPSITSPLVDAGLHPRGLVNWSLPAFDARGAARVDPVGERVDIGAYESHDRFFADRFEE